MKGYESSPKKIGYSDPENGESPVLTPFERLNERLDYPDLPIRDEYEVSPRYRLLELPRKDTNEFFLHFYNASGQGLRLRFYGVNRGGEVDIIPIYEELTAVAGRVPVTLPDGYDSYLVRVDIGLNKRDYEGELSKSAYFKVAAFAGEEPAPKGGLKRESGGKGGPQARYLPFSYDRRAFHRIVISTCSPDEDIRGFVKELGLEPSEAYFGPKGSVVALGVPLAMSLNTTRETTEDVRQTGNSDGNVSKDYIVNLFSPERPTDLNGGEDAKWSERNTSASTGPIEFSPPKSESFEYGRQPLTVAVIDSGIDFSEANAGHWKSTLYRQGPDTEYTTSDRYGFDFIRRSEKPVDEAPHGTYVAAALLNQYRSRRPLQLLHMKVFGEEGISSYFASLVSVYEAIAAEAKIINMSWGFYRDKEPRALYCALKTAANHGIFMVTSAGNDKENLDNKPQWPAAFADDFPCNLITVASYRYGLDDSERVDPVISNLAKADFTNYGVREVPLAAFYTSPVPEFETGRTHFPTGTSISAPIVAGLLASWVADHPNGTLSEFRKTYYHPTTELETVVTNGHHIRHDNAPRTV